VSAPAARPPSAQLAELDCVRGLAIALVVVHHATGLALLHPSAGHSVSPLAAFVYSGHTGVTLFFVLSGFLISRPFLATALGGPRVRLGHYLSRRALRIYPLYTVAVLAAVALTAKHASDLRHVLPHLLFLTPFTNVAKFIPLHSGVWWSLSTEAQFYLLTPVVAWACLRYGARRTGAVVLAAWALGYVLITSSWIPKRPQTYVGWVLSLPVRAPTFAVGVLLAWIHLRAGDRIRSRLAAVRSLHWGAGDALLLATLLALGMLLAAVHFDGFWEWEKMPLWHAAEAALWGTVVAFLLYVPLRLRPLLVNPALAWLGRISYPLYLVHYPALAALLPLLYFRLGGRLALVASVALCVAASAIAHEIVERPLLERGRRLKSASRPG
jgi:peptidoglycan/LPS O-acetylase OafA/YrhL